MEFSLFAASAPGLEPITAQELRQLGHAEASVVSGGVTFRGSRRDVYRANLWLRTAGRVLLRVGEFYAAAFSELRKKAGRLPWETCLSPAQPVALSVTCHKSRLYHSDAVAERVAGAIEDRLKRPIVRRTADNEDAPSAQLILVRLDHDKCVISLDSSGELLHRRGYRLATAKAPLRETLAAGILLASGWDKVASLIDPFCGAGTIPIEAALIAQNLAPGRARRFAFMDWPDFDAALWSSLCAEAEAQTVDARPPILASDRDAGAIDAARANAIRAGVAERIVFTRQAVSAIEPPPEAGWVVTNPPYGVRTRGNTDLRNLYAQLGNVLRAKCPGWQVALLSADAQLRRSTGLDLREQLLLPNGGLKISLATGKVA